MTETERTTSPPRYCSICGKPLDDGRSTVDTGMTEFGVVHTECASAEYEAAARLGR